MAVLPEDPCSNCCHTVEGPQVQSNMSLPRWLVSFFFDPEFDAQMQAHGQAEDVSRLRRVRFRHMARPTLPEAERKPKFRLRRPLQTR